MSAEKVALWVVVWLCAAWNAEAIATAIERIVQ